MGASRHGLEIGGAVVATLANAVVYAADDGADEVAKLYCAIRDELCRSHYAIGQVIAVPDGAGAPVG